VTDAPPGAPPHPLASGWRPALRHGGLAFGALMALTVAVVVLRALGPLSMAAAVAQGTVVPAVVHRVPLEAGPVTVRLALLLATAGAGWLLFRGGRRVAATLGGGPALRAVHGAKVAVAYAGGCLLVSFTALALEVPAGGGSGGLSDAVTPSVPGSFGWPFLLAAACGAAGGVAAAGPASDRELRARAILAGGWRMAWLSVALGTAGVLVVLALHPRAVRSSVDAAFGRGPGAGTLTLIGATLALPNAGAGAAAAAMGAGIRLEALGASCTVVSYRRFPAGGGTTEGPCGRLPFRIDTPSPGYLLFLLLPAAGTVAGGWLAGGRAGRESARAALLGAASGFAFAAWFAGWCQAARVVYGLRGPETVIAELQAGVGPDPLAAFLVALAWGPAGGALGGWLAGRSVLRRATGPDDPGPVEIPAA
jgi:hypothetical protein